MVLLVVLVYIFARLVCCGVVFFFQAEDGIRDLVRSRGLGDVYKRQVITRARAGGIFRGSVPINSLVLIVTVSGRSVLSLSLIHI